MRAVSPIPDDLTIRRQPAEAQVTPPPDYMPNAGLDIRIVGVPQRPARDRIAERRKRKQAAASRRRNRR